MSDLKTSDDDENDPVPLTNKHMPLKNTFRSLVNINQDSNYATYNSLTKNESSRKSDTSLQNFKSLPDSSLENFGEVSKLVLESSSATKFNEYSPDYTSADKVGLKENVNSTDKVGLKENVKPLTLSSTSLSFDSYDNSVDTIFVKDEPIVQKKEEPTKTHWLKGQLHNYISKSKDYYNKRSSVDDTDQMHKDNHDVNILKIAQITPESTLHPSVSTMVTEESHLPLLESSQRVPQNEKNSKSRLFKTQNSAHTQSTVNLNSKTEKMDNSKTIKSPRLTFSELLSSQNKIITNSPDILSPESSLNKDISVSNLGINALTELYVQEDLKDNLYPQQTIVMSYYQLFAASLLIYGYMMSFYPIFISGIFTGVIISYLYCCFTILKFCPSVDSINDYRRDLKVLLEENMKVVEEVKRLPKAEILQKPKDLKVYINFFFNFLLGFLCLIACRHTCTHTYTQIHNYAQITVMYPVHLKKLFLGLVASCRYIL